MGRPVPLRLIVLEPGLNRVERSSNRERAGAEFTAAIAHAGRVAAQHRVPSSGALGRESPHQACRCARRGDLPSAARVVHKPDLRSRRAS